MVRRLAWFGTSFSETSVNSILANPTRKEFVKMRKASLCWVKFGPVFDAKFDIDKIFYLIGGKKIIFDIKRSWK